MDEGWRDGKVIKDVGGMEEGSQEKWRDGWRDKWIEILKNLRMRGKGGMMGQIYEYREKRRKRKMREGWSSGRGGDERQCEEGKDKGSEGRTDGDVFLLLHLFFFFSFYN